MSYLNFKPNYDKYPVINIEGFQAVKGFQKIIEVLKEALNKKSILVVDCYPGVSETLLTHLKEGMSFERVICSEDIFYDEETITNLMHPHLTQDRVRGIMYYGSLMDFVDEEKLQKVQESLNKTEFTLIYGVGASLITKGDCLVYCDLARWEIQCRYRKGMGNFKCHNEEEDILLKYKRGYFIEWRIADKHKETLYKEMDYYVDSNQDEPKMISGEGFLKGLDQVVTQPFRLVPYFDPGVWGGQWMKEVCQLDPLVTNYAWSFDGVPEENSLYLQYGDIIIETPAMNVVKYKHKALLGAKNYARFGAEFPIRFDFLDTMEGQNLSLQVHPTTEYIKSHFGMSYTQDESYYILDAQEGSGVYLGLKENINSKEMIEDLRKAQKGEIIFEADKYVNFFEAKKHDHFLIPAGTIHCSSKNTMVLEVSATPYIFTFKLWDWHRVGLDGLPRPIHIEEGKEVIDFTRTTSWVKENLVNHFVTINEQEVQTGLHEWEFIETRVISSHKKTLHETHHEVQMLNLVEGKEIVIESPSHLFKPYTIHYAETFIVPASIDSYTIRNQDNEDYKVLKAYVRHD